MRCRDPLFPRSDDPIFNFVGQGSVGLEVEGMSGVTSMSTKAAEPPKTLG